MVLQTIFVIFKDTNGFSRVTYDVVFPIICILIIFDSLEYVIHAVNQRDMDPILIKLDYLLFNGHPTVILEKIMNPLLTDIMQLAYSSYCFLPATLGIVFKIKNDDSSFDRSLFLIMFCFYSSFLGYLLMQALGPRFTINHLQNMELKGLFIAQPIQQLLNRLEGVKRDAFSSGHTGVAITVLYLAFRCEKRLFWIFLPFVITLIFSTVYCRYHYVVDIIAGIMLSVIAVIFGEVYYGYGAKRVNINS